MKEVYLLWIYPSIGDKWIEGVYAHKIMAEKIMRLLREDDVHCNREGYSYTLQLVEFNSDNTY
jgi:hypothetical protein